MDDKNEKYIRSILESDKFEIADMYNECIDRMIGYTDSIYSRESLIDIMCEHAKRGDTFFAMAKDIEDNPFCEFFLFDYSCWGCGCTPIETKEEMAQVLLDGDL